MTFIYYLHKGDDVPFYIGKTKNIIRRKHKHCLDYKDQNIDLSVFDSCEDKVWKYWECFYIELFKQWGFQLKNKNKGGGGPSKYTEEQKQKMRKPHPGSGKKISKTLKERNHSKYYTPEIREKMSNALKGRKLIFSDRHKENLAEAALKKGKIIQCYSLEGLKLNEFKCLREAKEWLNNKQNLNSNFISKQIKDCCLGKQKTCRGYIWRYKDQIIIDTNFDYQNQIVNQFDENRELINSFDFNNLLIYLNSRFQNKNTCYVKRYKIFKLCEQDILNKINGYYWSFKNSI